MNGIFVSYAHEDQKKVIHIVEILRKAVKADVWFDPELHGGEDHFARISREIYRYDGFVFIASKASFASRWCVKELKYAWDCCKQIVIVRLDDTPVPKGTDISFTIFDSHHILYFQMTDSELEDAFAHSVLAETTTNTYKCGGDVLPVIPTTCPNAGNVPADKSSHFVSAEVSVKKGDIITFGRYPTKPIEWIVLETDGKTATLISKYGLDAIPYHETDTDVTWETCSLRQWLNEDFLDKAFREAEKSRLVEMAVKAEPIPDEEYAADPGNDTRDRVFLLNYQETERWLTSTEDGTCRPSRYAVSRGASAWKRDGIRGDTSMCYWWLRTQCDSKDGVLVGGFEGRPTIGTESVDSDDIAVRPAIVLRL